MMKKVYLDHAATTPLDERVLKAMEPFLTENFGNPSSFHTPGRIAKEALDEARRSVAGVLKCRSDEIIFTSGGTEADNLAILGFARKNKDKGTHIISTTVEHPAVMEPLRQLEKEGFEITYLPVDKYGLISPEQVEEALRPDTILVSVIYANNEIGTINPIAEIGNVIDKHKKNNLPAFHSDACQAVGALTVEVEKLHLDLMTINASKIYGPKGNGALYVKRGIKLQSLQFGGHQEKRIRPGTENPAGIIGFAEAVKIAEQMRERESARLIKLRDYFIDEIKKRVPKTRLNGHPVQRLPNNINISFMDIEGEALSLYLDAKGVYVSTGSACTSASLDPSHVIIALGLPYEVAHGSIRFTLGRKTTKEDLDYVLDVLPPLVEKLRLMSPVNVDEKYFE
ncbi:cysteine desulfurase [Candidatus Parcubacteria bacterium]|nr:MAG: cysteine desulfurase [Candidatus Parcubacteria bacterium]